MLWLLRNALNFQGDLFIFPSYFASPCSTVVSLFLVTWLVYISGRIQLTAYVMLFTCLEINVQLWVLKYLSNTFCNNSHRRKGYGLVSSTITDAMFVS